MKKQIIIAGMLCAFTLMLTACTTNTQIPTQEPTQTAAAAVTPTVDAGTRTDIDADEVMKLIDTACKATDSKTEYEFLAIMNMTEKTDVENEKTDSSTVTSMNSAVKNNGQDSFTASVKGKNILNVNGKQTEEDYEAYWLDGVAYYNEQNGEKKYKIHGDKDFYEDTQPGNTFYQTYSVYNYMSLLSGAEPETDESYKIEYADGRKELHIKYSITKDDIKAETEATNDIDGKEAAAPLNYTNVVNVTLNADGVITYAAFNVDFTTTEEGASIALNLSFELNVEYANVTVTPIEGYESFEEELKIEKVIYY